MNSDWHQHVNRIALSEVSRLPKPATKLLDLTAETPRIILLYSVSHRSQDMKRALVSRCLPTYPNLLSSLTIPLGARYGQPRHSQTPVETSIYFKTPSSLSRL